MLSSRKAACFAVGVILAAACGQARAQQDPSAPVKVSTIVHADGSQTTTQTDPAAGTVESITRDPTGAMTRRMVFKTGPDGRPASAEIYDGRGRLQYRSEFIRNAFGQVSEELRRNAAGGLIQRLVFESAPDGRILRTRAFGPDGRPMSADAPMPVVRGPAPAQQRGGSPGAAGGVRGAIPEAAAAAPVAAAATPLPSATPTPRATPRSRPAGRPGGRP